MPCCKAIPNLVLSERYWPISSSVQLSARSVLSLHNKFGIRKIYLADSCFGVVALALPPLLQRSQDHLCCLLSRVRSGEAALSPECPNPAAESLELAEGRSRIPAVGTGRGEEESMA